MTVCLCVFYLFYGGDSDNKEEGQTAGDWAGRGVDDKLQREKRRRRSFESNAVVEEEDQRGSDAK